MEIRTMITDLYEKLLPRYKSINFNISLEEILKLYNEGGNDQGVVEEKTIRQIIKNALKKI